MEEDKKRNEYGEQFAAWVKTLKDFERKFYFNKIALACDQTYNSVYQWSVQSRKLKLPAAKIINEVVGEEIIKL